MRLATFAAALAALFVAVPARADVPTAVLDPAAAELARVKDLERSIVSYHLLLQGESATKDVVAAALFDVERRTEELDSRLEAAPILIKDAKAIPALRMVVAKAHLEAALLHARGVDLENSIRHYERAVDLLGFDPVDWTEPLERGARPGSLANVADVVYDVAPAKEIVADLREFWSSGAVARFQVREIPPFQRARLQLKRVGGANDGFSRAAFELAAKRFAERVAAGYEDFRVVVPIGRYIVDASAIDGPPTEFRAATGVALDPIVVNPNRFSFDFVSPDVLCMPRLTLNGLPVKGQENLPFGAYTIEVPTACPRPTPKKITVNQAQEVTLRSEPERLDALRPGQPIFLFVTTPAGSTYRVRM